MMNHRCAALNDNGLSDNRHGTNSSKTKVELDWLATRRKFPELLENDDDDDHSRRGPDLALSPMTLHEKVAAMGLFDQMTVDSLHELRVAASSAPPNDGLGLGAEAGDEGEEEEEEATGTIMAEGRADQNLSFNFGGVVDCHEDDDEGQSQLTPVVIQEDGREDENLVRKEHGLSVPPSEEVRPREEVHQHQVDDADDDDDVMAGAWLNLLRLLDLGDSEEEDCAVEEALEKLRRIRSK